MGWIYFLQPTGEVRDLDEGSITGERGVYPRPKPMPVKILRKRRLQDVPLVLASLPCNRYFSSGTFRSIDNWWGNVKAACAVLGRPFPSPHLEKKDCTPAQLLE